MVEYINNKKFDELMNKAIESRKELIFLLAGINNPKRTFLKVDEVIPEEPKSASTIKLHEETKKKLLAKRIYPSETYEAVISRLLEHKRIRN